MGKIRYSHVYLRHDIIEHLPFLEGELIQTEGYFLLSCIDVEHSNPNYVSACIFGKKGSEHETGLKIRVHIPHGWVLMIAESDVELKPAGFSPLKRNKDNKSGD